MVPGGISCGSVPPPCTPGSWAAVLPWGGSTSVQYLYQFVFYLLANRALMAGAGENGVAIFNVLQNLSYLVLYLYDGAAKAAQPLVSTYAAERNRAGGCSTLTLALATGNGLGILLCLALSLAAPAVCGVFGLTEPSAVAAGAAAVRIYCLGLVLRDRLFLYTDGVTEATDEHQQLYGTRRLLDALNRSRDADPRTLLQAVQADIHAFVGAADPFDDITMLALEIKGMAHHYRLELAPTLEELPRATAFVEKLLQKEQVPPPLVYKFNVVMDELFSNIARYSGATRAAVVCFVQDGKVTLRFEDDGKPFDPLAAAEPDTTLSAEERNIGGLGVFLVKRMMDEMHYERRQEKNCLTLSLHLPGSPRP